MGERKVVNKYYPPDFDPSKLGRRRKASQNEVRMMLPMSIRCKTCGNYINKGTKFNSRMEKAIGDSYLGIRKFRFYFNCTNCSAELSIKSDPQHSDYVVESGATKNFQPWRSQKDDDGDNEHHLDSMKSLEKRSLDSKRKMESMAALDEIKSIKSRHATVSVDSMLQALQRSAAEKKKLEEEEDEKLIQSIVFYNSKNYVRRIIDDDDDEENMKKRNKR